MTCAYTLKLTEVCGESNLNGLYQTTGEVFSDREFNGTVWATWKGKSSCLQKWKWKSETSKKSLFKGPGLGDKDQALIVINDDRNSCQSSEFTEYSLSGSSISWFSWWLIVVSVITSHIYGFTKSIYISFTPDHRRTGPMGDRASP